MTDSSKPNPTPSLGENVDDQRSHEVIKAIDSINKEIKQFDKGMKCDSPEHRAFVDRKVGEVRSLLDRLRDGDKSNDLSPVSEEALYKALVRVCGKNKGQVALFAELLGVKVFDAGERLIVGEDENKTLGKEDLKTPMRMEDFRKASEKEPFCESDGKKGTEKVQVSVEESSESDFDTSTVLEASYIFTHKEDQKKAMLKDISALEKQGKKLKKDSYAYARLKSVLGKEYFDKKGQPKLSRMKADVEAGRFDHKEVRKPDLEGSVEDMEKHLAFLKTIPEDEDPHGVAKKYKEALENGYKGSFEQYDEAIPRTRFARAFRAIAKFFKQILSALKGLGLGDFIPWLKKDEEKDKKKSEDVLRIEKKIGIAKAVDKFSAESWKKKGINVKDFFQRSGGKVEDKRRSVLMKSNLDKDGAIALLKKLDSAPVGSPLYVALRQPVGKALDLKAVREIADNPKAFEVKDGQIYAKGASKPVDLTYESLNEAVKASFDFEKLKTGNPDLEIEDGAFDLNFDDYMQELKDNPDKDKENRLVLADRHVRDFIKQLMKPNVAKQVGTADSGELPFELLRIIAEKDLDVRIDFNKTGLNPFADDLKVSINGSDVGTFDRFGTNLFIGKGLLEHVQSYVNGGGEAASKPADKK